MRPPVVLVILDGYGINPDPHARGNAIRDAHTPRLDRLIDIGSVTSIPTSGQAVGLPDGQMGNSEVGHLNMGAGRVVYQDFTRISKSIHDGDFFTNAVLLDQIRHAKARGTALHLIGLVSDGGVHSHEDHLVALLDLCRREGLDRVWVHAFTDGRDVSPTSGAGSLRKLEEAMVRLGTGRIATVSGRYYAMDRDQRWERTRKAWAAMVRAEADHRAATGSEAVKQAYARGETDEFILPTLVSDEGRIRDEDAVLCFNFRPDRARQITAALALEGFSGFEREPFPRVRYACLTEYKADYGLPVAYAKQSLDRILAPVVADAGLRQLRCAETEKYAHVTFFFNGGVETPFPGEERILVPSPKVATYDMQPEMSAPQVAHEAARRIRDGSSDLFILNFANADMVGHTGDYGATVKAIEAVDAAVGEVADAVAARGGVMLVTADHGNAEMMIDSTTGGIHTAHTLFPVPAILVGRDVKLRPDGQLCDIAPTLLDLLGVEKPREMTARSLILG
ncbi:MAG: 2,3-bisphosphoglycerate-independent phosphoglycerate mutase [Candidatus Sericytochromatia bacterium]|nr:2,3-bisphosphoglycerate-independent phosphoglycerate mutase [Candidatus Sericytochromatia bacterium]